MSEQYQKIFNEKTHAYIAAKFYEKLVERFQSQGVNAFIHATQYYAEQRGRRMAQRAIRDDKPLTFETYNQYGEWISTDYTKDLGQANDNVILEKSPDFVLRVDTCPWHKQFEEMGMSQAGKTYCDHLDNSICRGFNPYLQYDIEKTLHFDDYCLHRIHNTNMDDNVDLSRKKEYLRDFDYHCAHIYWSFSEVVKAIFGETGEKINKEVMGDLCNEYGESAKLKILEYQNTNFNVAAE